MDVGTYGNLKKSCQFVHRRRERRGFASAGICLYARIVYCTLNLQCIQYISYPMPTSTSTSVSLNIDLKSYIIGWCCQNLSNLDLSVNCTGQDDTVR